MLYVFYPESWDFIGDLRWDPRTRAALLCRKALELIQMHGRREFMVIWGWVESYYTM